MKAVFDSSSFAKRYVEEKGSQEVEDICQNITSLGVSVILVPEIISGLVRYQREGNLSLENFDLAKNKLLQDVNDAQIINLTPKVIARSIVLIENNTLRTMDALHIACALEWGAELFISSDKRQIKVAKNEDLKVVAII
ncbi:MAG: type II toxin-antitoxin system VapC family toxin [Candidatus Anammoxibacter sp.]